jgi:hypothetical protein
MLRADLERFGAAVGFEDRESRRFEKRFAKVGDRDFIIDD